MNLVLIFRKIGDEISIMKIKQDCHFATAPREKLHLKELSELFFSKFKMSYFYASVCRQFWLNSFRDVAKKNGSLIPISFLKTMQHKIVTTAFFS